MPQAALFGGRHFGENVFLKQYSYIFICCGLHKSRLYYINIQVFMLEYVKCNSVDISQYWCT